jgi:hypothetical protein
MNDSISATILGFFTLTTIAAVNFAVSNVAADQRDAEDSSAGLPGKYAKDYLIAKMPSFVTTSGASVKLC